MTHARRWLTHAMVLIAAAVILTVPVATRTGLALGGANEASMVIQAMPGIVPVAATVDPPRAALPHLAWPLRGAITQPFGPSPYWFEPSIHAGSVYYAHFHTGIDIAAPWGTPVRSALAGRVEYAGWEGGYGYTVVLQHDGGLRTLYGHLERTSVRAGQSVGVGTLIGLAGATGNATGPHLHFEVRTAPLVVVDPMPYLEPARQQGDARSVQVQWPPAPTPVAH